MSDEPPSTLNRLGAKSRASNINVFELKRTGYLRSPIPTDGNLRAYAGVRYPGTMTTERTFIEFFPGEWYNRETGPATWSGLCGNGW